MKNNHIKQFISTIIPDLKNPNFNCSGEIKQSGYLIDDGLAFGYHSNMKRILKSNDISLMLYGGQHNKKLQVINLEAYTEYLIGSVKDTEDESYLKKFKDTLETIQQEIKTKSSNNKYFLEATSIFTQHIGVYLKGNIIGDDFFQVIMSMLDFIDVFEIEYNGQQQLVFYPKTIKQVKETTISMGVNDTYNSNRSHAHIKNDENTPVKNKEYFSVLLHKSIDKLDKDEFRYNNIMLLLKEVKDGYVDMRKHSLALKNKRGKYEIHEYVIGEDISISIDTKTNRVLSVSTKETKYHTYKNNNGIWVVSDTTNPSSTPIETDEFEYYTINSDPSTPHIQNIELRGAYTHVLRNILGFKPQTWQYKVLINQSRINYVAGVRRGGKTLLSSYLIIRFSYRQPSSRKHILRQPKGIYVITSKDKFKAVLDYIEAQSSRIKVLKSLTYIKRQDRLILSDDKLDFAQNKYQEIQSTYDFISAKGYKTGVGNGGDDIIMDESSTISEDVWLNLAPIVTNEGAGLFCISTIDWTTPKQWFYSNLVMAERGEVEDTYAQRVTIDDIDENIMDNKAKDHAKSILKHNMSRYLGELYATFSSESQVFSSEGSIVLENPTGPYEEIIIGYDPAKRSDYGAIVVCGVLKKTLYFIEEYQLQGDYSTYQKQVLFDVKQKYLDQTLKTTLIMDGTSAGDVVAEILGNIVDYKVWYTGDTSSNYKPHVDDFGSWKVSKTRLVTTTQLLFETKRLKINSSLVNLQGEISTFKAYVVNGKQKYDAISGEHDDLINAVMLASFYYGYIEGNISNLTKDNDNEFRTMNKKYMDSKTGLYKEYFKTIKSQSQRRTIEGNTKSKHRVTKKVGYYI